MGSVLPLAAPEVAEARKLYLARYANSKYWVDFEDFSFHRMDVVDLYYVGGFGVTGVRLQVLRMHGHCADQEDGTPVVVQPIGHH